MAQAAQPTVRDEPSVTATEVRQHRRASATSRWSCPAWRCSCWCASWRSGTWRFEPSAQSACRPTVRHAARDARYRHTACGTVTACDPQCTVRDARSAISSVLVINKSISPSMPFVVADDAQLVRRALRRFAVGGGLQRLVGLRDGRRDCLTLAQARVASQLQRLRVARDHQRQHLRGIGLPAGFAGFVAAGVVELDARLGHIDLQRRGEHFAVDVGLGLFPACRMRLDARDLLVAVFEAAPPRRP